MTIPRFRIAWLMVAVALVAVDLGAIRGLFEFRDTFSELVGVGVLPMANLLAVGAAVGAARRRFPPFLAGFEVFGAAAMLACLTWAWLSPNSLTLGLLRLLIPVTHHFRTELFGVGPANYAIAGLLLSLPQVGFALLGGGLASFVARRRRRSGPA